MNRSSFRPKPRIALGRSSLALGCAALLGFGTTLFGASAGATVVERVVAIIGERAIFLSDMRMRARPFLAQIAQRGATGAQGAAMESELYKQLLEKMVDEQLETQAADKAHLSVTSDEIDNSIRNVASQQNLTVERLMEEAQKTGITALEYRDEIRRQLLEGKLLQLRVRGRVRVTDDDVKGVYTKLERTERRQLDYRLSWIVLHVRPTATAEDTRAIDVLARQIVATARAGHDSSGRPVSFASLATTFSDDATSRGHGGDLGKHSPGDLAPEVEEETLKLAIGQVSDPFRFKDAIVVMQITERDPSKLPAFDAAKDELVQRAYGEQLDKARRQWLQELRRGVYVDVRL